MKKIVLNIDKNDNVQLTAKGFGDSIEELEEVFHILASGTRMIATKVEQMKMEVN